MLVTSATSHDLSPAESKTANRTAARRVAAAAAAMAEEHPRKAWNNSFSIDAIMGAGSQKRARSDVAARLHAPTALSAFHVIAPASSPASGESTETSSACPALAAFTAAAAVAP